MEAQQPTQSSLTEKVDIFGISECPEEMLNFSGESQQGHHLRDPGTRNSFLGCDLRSRQSWIISQLLTPFLGEVDRVFGAFGNPVPAVAPTHQPLNTNSRVREGVGNKGLSTLFVELWGQRKQCVSRPFGRPFTRLASCCFDAPLLLWRNTNLKHNAARVVLGQLGPPHAFAHGGSVA